VNPSGKVTVFASEVPVRHDPAQGGEVMRTVSFALFLGLIVIGSARCSGDGASVKESRLEDSCPVVDPIGPCVDGCCDAGAVCVNGNCFGIPQ